MSFSPRRFAPTALAALLALSFTAGCNKEKTPAATPSAAATPAAQGEPSPDTVVATYGNEKITFGQLNERLKEPLANMESEYRKQKQQMREQGLEGMITERLVQSEAKKRNVTEEQLIKSEVEDKAPVPSDAEVKKLFDQAQSGGQLPPGTTLEQVKPQIVSFLQQGKKRELAQAFFEKLRKDNNVQVTLPKPPVERKEVAATGPARGPENAPITMVEFSDFQCPFCGRAVGTVEQVMQAYPDKIRLVFRQFPLEMHAQAPKAAEAALCANEQGKFWPYHDTLFKNQQALSVDDLKKHATSVGLDGKKFAECLDSGKMKATVDADQKAGTAVGVTGTPAFFINGVMLSGAQPLDEFKKVIDQELQAKK
jgi:protein-disulfide isomerase